MHTPVMLDKVVELLAVKSGGRYVDGTLGGAGHAEALLMAAGSGAQLLGIDRDVEAVERARVRLAPFGSQAQVVHGDFGDLEHIVSQHHFSPVDGVLLDLGMSSFQVDEPARGFSFMREGPLDMRMDQSCGQTAADLVNTMDERALALLFRELGEEPSARKVAQAIVLERMRAPFQTTAHLAALVEKAKGGRRGRTHPATQVFQALRMAVNHELDQIEAGVRGAVRTVCPGGRVAVITFHSLEDRAVKKIFAEHAGRWESLAAGGERWVGLKPVVSRITRKPMEPTEEEVRVNPRARSAKLRVVERVKNHESRT